jgi:integrase
LGCSHWGTAIDRRAFPFQFPVNKQESNVRAIERLNQAEVNRLIKTAARGNHPDGANLYLQIKCDKLGGLRGASWLYKYWRPDAWAGELGLGPARKVPLDAARERAKRFNDMLIAGKDPMTTKATNKAATAKLVTFGAYARTACDAATTSSKYGPDYAAKWYASLDRHAKPLWKKLLINIDASHVQACLTPIWHDKEATADIVRGRIEAVFEHAKAAKMFAGDNPATNKTIAILLGAQSGEVKHREAVPFEAMPAFMRKLRATKGRVARCLEWLILTAVRSGEATGAKWSEIDRTQALWTIPAERMKAGREHRVPLSPRAMQILLECDCYDQSELVFGEISQRTLIRLVTKLHKGATTHGFRSSFRDWAGDKTTFPREVAEAALAHVNGDKAEAAYRRGDALDKRREMMTAWAAFLG